VTEAQAAKHGEKWTCEDCGTKYYDLNKKGPGGGSICPECGKENMKVVVLPPGTPRKPKSRSSFTRGGRPEPAKAKPEDENPDGAPDDDDEEDDGLPTLGDDDDDDADTAGLPGDDANKTEPTA